MNNERVSAEVAKIREILDEQPGGEPNETARIQVRRHADAIIHAAPDQGYIIEKAHDIQSHIDQFYSARKHLKYKGDCSDGAEVLRSRIDSLLGRIESWHGWEDSSQRPDKS
jgi:hypothetical protein